MYPLPICPGLVAAVRIIIKKYLQQKPEESESKTVSMCTAWHLYLQHVESYSLPIQQGEKVKVMKTLFFIYTRNIFRFSVRRAAKQWGLKVLKCLKACCQVNLNTEWKRWKSWSNLKYWRKWNFMHLLRLTSAGKCRPLSVPFLHRTSVTVTVKLARLRKWKNCFCSLLQRMVQIWKRLEKRKYGWDSVAIDSMGEESETKDQRKTTMKGRDLGRVGWKVQKSTISQCLHKFCVLHFLARFSSDWFGLSTIY